MSTTEPRSINDTSAGQCSAHLTLQGENFRCDLAVDHSGWAHSSKAVGAIWSPVAGPQTGVGLIAAERQRVIDIEGYTPAHDAEQGEDMALAGACYALPERKRRDLADPKGVPYLWPWHTRYWKPVPEDRLRELVKAGQLIAAEIDRILAEEKP